VFGDFRDSQLIGIVAMKLPVDAVTGGGHTGDAPEARSAGDPLDSSTAHEQLDGLMANDDTLSEGQVGVNAADPIGAPGGAVDLPDQIGEPGVSDSPS
jgi:hypothetical protein